MHEVSIPTIMEAGWDLNDGFGSNSYEDQSHKRESNFRNGDNKDYGGNCGGGCRDNNWPFRVKALKIFEEDIQNLRQIKKPPCVLQPSTKNTKYDKVKPEKMKSIGSGMAKVGSLCSVSGRR